MSRGLKPDVGRENLEFRYSSKKALEFVPCRKYTED